MPSRVLTGLFGHETNTFSRLSTTIVEFSDYLLAYGDEIPNAVKGTVIEPNGVEEVAEFYNWELVRSVVAWATPSGRVTRDAWNSCVGHVLRTAEEGGTLDGVLFNLHGAMATDDHDDAEGVFLEELRRIIGPDIPVAITLDLHANVTDKMAQHANIISAYRTYPHVDQIDTVKRAAAILDRAMVGKIKPISHIARRAMLTGLDSGRTTSKTPMTEILSQADQQEAADPNVLLISVQAGFCPADLDQAGPSVVVCGNGRNERYQAIAETFMDFAWETRHFDSNVYLSVDATMARLKELGPSNGPIVIADCSDNPGSGAYGDSTFLLASMLQSNLDNAAFATIFDPKAASQLQKERINARVTLEIGGKTDPKYGPPLRVTGRIVSHTDGSYLARGPRWGGTTQQLGPTAVLRVDGIDIVVASRRLQCTELETFYHTGIDPREKKVLAVKSLHHFRAAYAPIASHILICDSGGLATKDLTKLPYENLRRPIYPLDIP
ncbi:MAG: hypothetical protein CBB68_08940 [Rhodospirillaceae bacterium TMED8]|nr:microcystin degradation protein MlrC [Magnetovibrio sp.]OUT50486.1 MAG: hypothetical protein CBB68_08940 [Rhodospirillaceae bacterium TMED8]|tara:strand:- start:299 stop:1783 length:1485 start_codon:yes stop_codon:yes gene_type:complete